jgi:hypothetical protein
MMYDKYTSVKVWDLQICLNVKFLPTILKYVWPDDGLVLDAETLLLAVLLTVLLKCTFYGYIRDEMTETNQNEAKGRTGQPSSLWYPPVTLTFFCQLFSLHFVASITTLTDKLH